MAEPENSEKVIRVGSRKSELALIQTKHVIAQLQKLNPKKKFEIHTMSTIGDRVLNVSLPKIGEKSLFTRDLEDALRNGGVDFVVHSLKDLPTALPTGMAIGAVLEREDSRDALVLNEKHKGLSIQTLPAGSVIGTSSLRRTAQLRRLYPHLEICDIRGNLNTRLAKLDAPNSKFSGIILAQAGLIRMGWMKRISQILEPDHILYAVGQGALAVECRANDDEILGMLQRLMCLETSCKILAERSFLKTLGGGCSAPVAVSTNLTEILQNNSDSKVHLEITGAVWSLDGKTEIREYMKRSLHLGREEEDSEEEASPSKRVKIDTQAGGDHNSSDKQDSPKVITDDEVTLNVPPSDDSKMPNLQYLMEVHGELFKKCPFYALHERDKDNGNSSTSKGECPLRIPVGQDFMGKCPYVDTEQKVELSHDLEGVCPVTKMKFDKSSVNRIGDTVDNANIPKLKCPFSKEAKSINEIKADKPKAKRLSLEDCPFFQRSIKLIDYDENKPAVSSEAPCLADVADELFCGLYRHKCYNQHLFMKCENLGRELAERLIKVGALNVMQLAQQEIREKA